MIDEILHITYEQSDTDETIMLVWSGSKVIKVFTSDVAESIYDILVA